MKKVYLIALSILTLSLTAFVVHIASKGIDLQAMDTTVNPGDDFFRYVNGNWFKQNPIPAAEARWGNFNVLAEQNTEKLRMILETASKDKSAAPGSIRKKVGDFWLIAMDTLKLEQEGIMPAMADWNAIDAVQNMAEWFTLLSKFHMKGIGGLFGCYVSQDPKNSERYVVWVSQGGLGLPDRDYYLKQDEKSKKIRYAYVLHLQKMFALFHTPEPAATQAANQILAFETGLAENNMSRVDNRNMEKKYNPRAIKDLVNTMPNIAWNTYFDLTGIQAKGIDTVLMAQPAYFAYLNQAIEKESLENLKVYLKWKLMGSCTGYLSDEVGKLSFEFYGTVIQGTKEQKPRWKRAVGSANGMIGELLAQEYVKLVFSESSKKKVNEMVDNMREAYRIRIQNLDWMSPETKIRAMEKLAAFNRKLGYPDKWEDYSKLEIKTDSYLANHFRASEFGHRKMVDQLGKPVDRSKWNMLPQTVNAYYSSTMNEIVFPAAIMQPPFFDPNADDAVNYGAIGAVIGHEFSHGFDDQGSKYDAKGNFNSWWTADDRKKFDERTKVIVNQYNAFKVADSVYVNGELTLGENIADIAGLLVAYDALQISLKGKPRVKIDGFTPEQRFFLGFAQVWRGHARPEYVRNQVLTDPHSPQEFRVKGTLSNMPAFYEAFAVKAGQAMWKSDQERVNVW
ncbi:MAG: M13 family metallopeptidase [Bacteroidia bacterium]|jgi:putative endopeptidase